MKQALYALALSAALMPILARQKHKVARGLDSRALNGGIILTGGGSQLKHLIQLTEYTTGLNARIGLPNEHLAPNHIDELKKPMYSTCIGLILKGYSDYDHKYTGPGACPLIQECRQRPAEN